MPVQPATDSAPGRSVTAEGAVNAQGLSFLFASERIDSPTDWGFAEACHVVVVHLAGRLQRLETVFDNGPVHAVLPEPGDSWIIPAGHRYAAAACGDRVAYCEIRLPAPLIGHRELAPRAGHKDEFLHHAVVRMAGLARRTDDLAGLQRASLAESLRLHLADTLGSRQRERPAYDPRRFADLALWVRDNLDARHTVADMAAYVGLPPDAFLRGFAAALGTTPHRWLLDERLARARTLLASPRHNITDIAMATGFASPSHFASSFRQRLGLTPSAYRRAIMDD